MQTMAGAHQHCTCFSILTLVMHLLFEQQGAIEACIDLYSSYTVNGKPRISPLSHCHLFLLGELVDLYLQGVSVLHVLGRHSC